MVEYTYNLNNVLGGSQARKPLLKHGESVQVCVDEGEKVSHRLTFTAFEDGQYNFETLLEGDVIKTTITSNRNDVVAVFES